MQRPVILVVHHVGSTEERVAEYRLIVLRQDTQDTRTIRQMPREITVRDGNAQVAKIKVDRAGLIKDTAINDVESAARIELRGGEALADGLEDGGGKTAEGAAGVGEHGDFDLAGAVCAAVGEGHANAGHDDPVSVGTALDLGGLEHRETDQRAREFAGIEATENNGAVWLGDAPEVEGEGAGLDEAFGGHGVEQEGVGVWVVGVHGGGETENAEGDVIGVEAHTEDLFGYGGGCSWRVSMISPTKK